MGIILNVFLKWRLWGADRIHLAQDRVQKLGLVNTLMKLRVPQ
jgi:hypothetical protein